MFSHTHTHTQTHTKTHTHTHTHNTDPSLAQVGLSVEFIMEKAKLHYALQSKQ